MGDADFLNKLFFRESLYHGLGLHSPTQRLTSLLLVLPTYLYDLRVPFPIRCGICLNALAASDNLLDSHKGSGQPAYLLPREGKE